MDDRIVIRGARQHNLKNVNLEIPRNRLVLITGVSGSGKSSLAFDTIYAESQRRYLESFSVHTRRFFQKLEPPEADSITGLSPAVAIGHGSFFSNPRSTVATLSEIADYIRLLYSHLGTVVCPFCRLPIYAYSVTQMVEEIMKWARASRVLVLAPLGEVSERDLIDSIRRLRRDGYVRVRINRRVYSLDQPVRLPRSSHYELEVVVDRIVLKEDQRRRLSEALHLSSQLSEGLVKLVLVDGNEERLFSEHFKCLKCGYKAPRPAPNLFSFTHPQGACFRCHGLGYIQGAFCPECGGSRFNEMARTVKLGGLAINEIFALSPPELREWLQGLSLSSAQEAISSGLKQEILTRLEVMERLGLGYLTLDRAISSLSSGEILRIRLARQLNTSLSGIIYVLDEPSIGLHVRDRIRLLEVLRELRDLGNTVLVVEHDLEILKQADYVVEMGPGAGIRGGEVVFAGDPKELINHPHSITGLYLSGKRSLGGSRRRPPSQRDVLILEGARGHNLQNITARFPLNCLICVTGVSGSGKSTLVVDTLYPALRHLLHGARNTALPFERIDGYGSLGAVRCVDHLPVGRSPRSTPATYVGAFKLIRELFARLPEARARGYDPRRFSFNVKGGRCEACKGEGVQRIDMDFLPDMFVTCPVCSGSRYEGEILDIRYKGYSIADILRLTVSEALALFENIPSIYHILKVLFDVGLGYLRLGQGAITLSAGEAQRLKLARELSRPNYYRTLYIMDEPTTGLHPEDIRQFIDVVQKLIEKGHTVIMLEHNLELIKMADYVIDLGPGAGPNGGHIVAQGPPVEIAKNKNSHTGKALCHLFGDGNLSRYSLDER